MFSFVTSSSLTSLELAAGQEGVDLEALVPILVYLIYAHEFFAYASYFEEYQRSRRGRAECCWDHRTEQLLCSLCCNMISK